MSVQGAMGHCPLPDKQLEQSIRRSELTVGVWTAPLRERGQGSGGNRAGRAAALSHTARAEPEVSARVSQE